MKRALRGNNVAQPTEPVAAEGRLAKVVRSEQVDGVAANHYWTLVVGTLSMRSTRQPALIAELENMADLINGAVEKKIQEGVSARLHVVIQRLLGMEADRGAVGMPEIGQLRRASDELRRAIYANLP